MLLITNNDQWSYSIFKLLSYHYISPSPLSKAPNLGTHHSSEMFFLQQITAAWQFEFAQSYLPPVMCALVMAFEEAPYRLH